MSVIGGTPFVSTDSAGNQVPYSAGGLPNGVANNLTWTSTLNSCYTASIAVAGITQKSSVQATIALSLLAGASNFTDAINCWLVSSYCYDGGVAFVVAGNPASPSTFPIVWSIVDGYAA